MKNSQQQKKTHTHTKWCSNNNDDVIIYYSKRNNISTTPMASLMHLMPSVHTNTFYFSCVFSPNVDNYLSTLHFVKWFICCWNLRWIAVISCSSFLFYLTIFTTLLSFRQRLTWWVYVCCEYYMRYAIGSKLLIRLSFFLCAIFCTFAIVIAKRIFLCLCLFLSCSIQFTWSIHYVSNNLHCSVCIEIKWVSFRKRERDSEIYIIHTSHSMHQQLAVFRWLPVTIKHRAGSIVYMRCDCDLTIKYKTRFFVLDVLVVVVPLFYISIDWHRTDE